MFRVLLERTDRISMVLQLGTIKHSSHIFHPGNCSNERVAALLDPYYYITRSGDSLILQPKANETRQEQEINIHLRISPENITLYHSIAFLDRSHSLASLLGDCNHFNKQHFLIKATVHSADSFNGTHTVLVSSTISLLHGCSFSTLTSRLNDYCDGIKSKVYPFFK